MEHAPNTRLPDSRKTNANASDSMFNKVPPLIPRSDFECIVKETVMEYHSSLSSWSQFVAMGSASWDMPTSSGKSRAPQELQGHADPIGHRTGCSESLNDKSHGASEAPLQKQASPSDSAVIDRWLSMYNCAKFRCTKGANKLYIRWSRPELQWLQHSLPGYS